MSPPIGFHPHTTGFTILRMPQNRQIAMNLALAHGQTFQLQNDAATTGSHDSTPDRSNMPDRRTPRHHMIEWFFTTTEVSGGNTTIVLCPREVRVVWPARTRTGASQHSNCRLEIALTNSIAVPLERPASSKSASRRVGQYAWSRRKTRSRRALADPAPIGPVIDPSSSHCWSSLRPRSSWCSFSFPLCLPANDPQIEHEDAV